MLKKLFYGILLITSCNVFATIESEDFVGDWVLSPVSAFSIGTNQGWEDIFRQSGISPDLDCFFDDIYSFKADGSFQLELFDSAWLHPFQGYNWECGEPIFPHDGSNEANWHYEETAGTLTLSGYGAYIGLPDVTNNGLLGLPSNAPMSITYFPNVTGETMTLDIRAGDIETGNDWFRFELIRKKSSTHNGASIDYSFLPNGISIDSCSPSTTCPDLLALPDSIDGEFVVSINDFAFREMALTQITLPSNLIHIGESSFQGNMLSSLTIPEGVEQIEGFAFEGNNIQEITFPESITSIGTDAFRNNNISKIVFLGDLPQIGGSTFAGQSIESVEYCAEKNGWGSQNPYFTIGGVMPTLSPECSETYSTLDLDQNGSFDALTDALILLRYAFGLRGDSLISNAVASDANRTTAEDIEAHIQSLLP